MMLTVAGGGSLSEKRLSVVIRGAEMVEKKVLMALLGCQVEIDV